MPYQKSSPKSPEAQSASPVQDNLKALASLFPSVVRDGQVDVDALRQLCGEAVVKDNELYGLNWRGKVEARRAALIPSLGTLRPCKEESKDWDSTKNLYIEGDNLEVLKLLRKSYGGKVKVIYIDPPYNTGKEFVYPDNYQDSIENYKRLTGQEGKYAVNAETSGRYHTDWLNMMYPRLILARDFLIEDGLIFISIDDGEVANIIKLCAEIFGEQNFINCFVWNCSTAGGIRPKYVSKTHEYILCYAKNKCHIPKFYAALSDRAVSTYTQQDDKGLYRDKDFVFKNQSNNKNQKYDILCPDGEVVHPKEGYIYRFVKETYEGALREGLVTFKKSTDSPLVDKEGKKSSWNIYIKKYLGDGKGAPASLIPKEHVGTYNSGTNAIKHLFGGVQVFENAKPIDLIQYIIQLNDTRDSTYMDFFSGSATTAHAVMQLNAEDGGNRRFIMVQLPESCDEKREAYKAGYINICEIGKELIRRAGEKVKEEAREAGKNLDVGFRVFKLDSSNVKAWNPLAEDLASAVNNYAEHLVGGRTEDDFLAEIMLKSGIDLVEEVAERVIAGHRVQSLGYGQYYACMSADITADVEEVALGIAAWHEEDSAYAGGEPQDTCTVFVSDRAFGEDDAAKMNFVAILEQHGICNIKAL